MPTGRCEACGFLCNPDLIGCPDPERPCPRRTICYCSQICQERDLRRHQERFHSHRRRDKDDDGSARRRERKTERKSGPNPGEGPDGAGPGRLVPSPSCENPIESQDDLGGARAVNVPEEEEEKEFEKPVEDKEEEGDKAGSGQAVVKEKEEPVKVASSAQESPRVEEEEATTTTKTKTRKSRLEMRREARRTKKAARRQERLAILSAMKKKKKQEQEEEEEEDDDDDDDDDDDGKEEEEKEEASGQADRDESDLKVSNDAKEGGEPTSPRRMTKREKKREERRIQNAKKKMEKQRQKELEQLEEKESRKREAAALIGEGKFLEGAVALTRLMNSGEEGDYRLFSLRRDSYLGLGKARQALEDARRAVDLNRSSATSAEDAVKLLRLQILVGDLDEASKTFEDLGKGDGHGDMAEEARALSEAKRGFSELDRALDGDDWPGAVETAQRLERICPHSADLNLGRAEAQAHLRVYREAGAAVARIKLEAAREQGGGGRARVDFVENLLDYYNTSWWQEEKKEPRVLEKFRVCCEESPGLAVRSAKMHARATAVKSAYKAARLALKKREEGGGGGGGGGGDVDGGDCAGEAQIEVSDADTRADILRSLTTADPGHSRLAAEAHLLAAAVGDGGGDEDRLRALTASLRLRETAEARMARGGAHRARRRYTEALEDYEAALRIEPANQEARRLADQMRRHLNSGGGAGGRRQGGLRCIAAAATDLYNVLGVHPEATTEEIHKAYRRGMRDLQGSSSGRTREEQEDQLGRAYRVLRDGRRREIYDRQRKRAAADDDDSEEDYEAYESEDDEEDDDEATGAAVSASSTSMTAAAAEGKRSGGSGGGGGGAELADMLLRYLLADDAQRSMRGVRADRRQTQLQQQGSGAIEKKKRE